MKAARTTFTTTAVLVSLSSSVLAQVAAPSGIAPVAPAGAPPATTTNDAPDDDDAAGATAAPNAASSAPGSASATSAPSANVPTASNPAPSPKVSCVEDVPEGKERPRMTESFPQRGRAGFALELILEIEHGKGETVLPGGFEIVEDAEGAKELQSAGFTLPHAKGPAAPRVEPLNANDRTGSRVAISFVALPSEPGQSRLTLPSLPIAISRASGEMLTLCTRPHEITIVEPTANEPHASPKANPAPRRQLEEWDALRNAVIGGAAALLLGALAFWLGRKWMRRPRNAPPPPPPRPPWEVAMEELHAIRHAGLIDQERFAEHFDRVSHIVREYLGNRYGFDGLESTTRETLRLLESVHPEPTPMATIRDFLRQADLVKFAQLTPTAEECRDALGRGDSIVRDTMPSPMPAGSRPDATPSGGHA